MYHLTVLEVTSLEGVHRAAFLLEGPGENLFPRPLPLSKVAYIFWLLSPSLLLQS